MIRPRIAPVALALIAIVLLAACSGRNAEPTIAPTPSRAPTDTPIPDAWQRIRANGAMIVGTSADYEPFSYYDENFQIVGFDPALIRAVGEKLGVEVAIRDFAFDGLLNAVQLGQVDVAIAALSPTTEREALVDFSNVYYVGEAVAIAAPDSELNALNSPRALADKRVGVLTGSVYETWMRQTLIETGLAPADNLQLYASAANAIASLGEGQIDVVLLDLLPAQKFVDAGLGKIVGRGFSKQTFAIALPKNAGTLRSTINRALTDLQQEGVLAELAEQYLNLRPVEVQPTPTPEPPTFTPTPTAEPVATGTPVPIPTNTDTPTPVATCVNGMAWVRDITYNDFNMTAPPVIPPGQAFVKSWLVENTGTCAWATNYDLGFVQGNTPSARMGGESEFIARPVQPGERYTIDLPLVSPLTPGVYQGIWQMHDATGQTFGQRIWVGITVPGTPTPTPPPTATPAPTATPLPDIQFTVDRTQIAQGQCVTFRWNVQNVRAVYFYSENETPTANGVSGVSSQNECPTTTTTYYLTVVKQNDAIVTQSIRITVLPGANAPVIRSFSLDPSFQIPLGSCVTLRWSIDGQVSRVQLARNNIALWDGAPVSGSLNDCPPALGAYTYVLTASGPSGTNQATQQLNVVGGAPTPPSGVPVIQSFSITPAQLQGSGCVQVAWTVSGNPAVVQLLRNGLVVLDNAPASAWTQDCLSQTGTYTYRIRASGGGQTAVQDIPLTVR